MTAAKHSGVFGFTRPDRSQGCPNCCGRPEKPGVVARRDAQFQSRRDPRSIVRQQPVLRSQGSAPGALRAGATIRRRRYVRQRRGCIVWGHPTNLLQAQRVSATSGLAGLLPRPPDQKTATSYPAMWWPSLPISKKTTQSTKQACLTAIEKRYGITVSRRSLESVLARKKNREANLSNSCPVRGHRMVCDGGIHDLQNGQPARLIRRADG